MSDKMGKQPAKISESDTEEVSSGAFGKDWFFGPEYETIYKELGIAHGKSDITKDLYVYKGNQITKKQAYQMVDDWYREHGVKK